MVGKMFGIFLFCRMGLNILQQLAASKQFQSFVERAWDGEGSWMVGRLNGRRYFWASRACRVVWGFLPSQELLRISRHRKWWSQEAKKQISPIELNGETIEDPIIMVDKFNNFFSNIGPELQTKILSCNENPSEYLGKAVPNSMFLAPTTDQEIMDTIGNLKNTTSVGCDNIPLHLIKFCETEFTVIPSQLINNSMTEGIFSWLAESCKNYSVFKSADPKSLTNYRPISILTTFSKIFEKIVAVRLNGFITKNIILHENQFGFRSGLSTSMALLQLVNELTESIDDKKI